MDRKENPKRIIEGEIYKFGNHTVFQEAGKPYVFIDNISLVDLLKLRFSTRKRVKIRLTIEEE